MSEPHNVRPAKVLTVNDSELYFTIIELHTVSIHVSSHLGLRGRPVEQFHQISEQVIVHIRGTFEHCLPDRILKNVPAALQVGL